MSNDRVTLLLGDCIEVMRTLPDASVDAIVTDPPYELGFMGKSWDASGIANSVPLWREALRVLKPGGHLAAFGGTRTYHRMACAVEDAGFEVRDSLAWLYGSGFPKSLNVSKAIDRAAGAERERVPATGGLHANANLNDDGWANITAISPLQDSPIAVTDAARDWDGWGTALKPAYEPIVLARKPLGGSTVASNVLQHGTGALNIDATRIVGDYKWRASDSHPDNGSSFQGGSFGDGPNAAGRWPANVLLDEEAAAMLDAQTGERRAGGNLTGTEPSRPFDVTYGEMDGRREWSSYGDSGGASRFFYTAKASRSEREAGVEVEPERRVDSESRDDDAPGSNNPRLRTSARANTHPTVKPVDLMRWLCRLVTPPGGLILDPFLGSGTTAMAALDEGFRCIGIERDERYMAIARDRIEHRHLLDAAAPTAATEGLPQGRLL